MRTPSTAVDVIVENAAWAAACPDARRLARTAARRAVARGMARRRLARPPRIELAVALADDGASAGLNARYRGKPGPTNVLSFPASDRKAVLPKGMPLALGDVVLALETVLREAAEQQKPVADHLVHLVVHGVLHLIGYDHISEADARRMEALEKSILGELGVPDPYCDAM